LEEALNLSSDRILNDEKMNHYMFRAVPLPETCRGSSFRQNKFGKLVRLLVVLWRNSELVVCILYDRHSDRSIG
jgi:hypothetical protein